LIHTVLGRGLLAAGASAHNQLLERHRDALMARTENRPLPTGRVTPLEVLLFGLGLGIGGTLYLAIALRQPWTPLLAVFTFVTYVGIYTPLKSRTIWNTLIGAVPGAMPPIIGWSAVKSPFEGQALSLFLVLFLWQLPHFMAIAWIYRADYARAGLRMVPIGDRSGRTTSIHMVGFALLLLGASLVPIWTGPAGSLYIVGAALCGLGFLATTLDFWRKRDDRRAKVVLRASLVYLPAMLALFLIDGWTGS